MKKICEDKVKWKLPDQIHRHTTWRVTTSSRKLGRCVKQINQRRCRSFLIYRRYFITNPTKNVWITGEQVCCNRWQDHDPVWEELGLKARSFSSRDETRSNTSSDTRGTRTETCRNIRRLIWGVKKIKTQKTKQKEQKQVNSMFPTTENTQLGLQNMNHRPLLLLESSCTAQEHCVAEYKSRTPCCSSPSWFWRAWGHWQGWRRSSGHNQYVYEMMCVTLKVFVRLRDSETQRAMDAVVITRVPQTVQVTTGRHLGNEAQLRP